MTAPTDTAAGSGGFSGLLGFRNTGVVIAGLVIIFGTGPRKGLFVYAGTPALGNPPVFYVVAPGVTHDPYGNSVSAVMGAGNLGGAFTQIDQFGDLILFNTTGNQIIALNPTRQSLFIYSPSAAFGNLVASVSSQPAASTDAFGNAYLPGFASYALGSDGNFYASRLAGVQLSFYMAATAAGPYVLESGILAAGFDLHLNSSNLIVAEEVMVAQNPASPGTPETWHSLGSPSATGWTTTRGRYRMTVDGKTLVQVIMTATGATPANGSFTFANVLPAAYRPPENQPFPMTCTFNPGTAPRARIDSSGNVVIVIPAGSATGDLFGGTAEAILATPA